MQRARRLASVAVVASLAVAGLTACRSAPSTAAYIGSGAGAAKVSQNDVEAIYKDSKLNGTEARTATDGSITPPAQHTRQQIVDTMVGLDVFRAYGKANNITPQAVAADQMATSMFLKPGAKFVPLYAEYEGYLEAAGAKVAPQQVTEADVRDIFNRLTAAGILGNTTFETWVGGISQQLQQLLAQRIALKKAIEPVAAKMDIVVNPRYSSSISLLETYDPQGKPFSVLDVPVGDPADGVPVTAAG